MVHFGAQWYTSGHLVVDAAVVAESLDPLDPALAGQQREQRVQRCPYKPVSAQHTVCTQSRRPCTPRYTVCSVKRGVGPYKKKKGRTAGKRAKLDIRVLEAPYASSVPDIA
eukprot:2187411-Rhodomonas_salina.1